MRLVQFIRKAPGWKVQVFGAELGEGGDIVDLSHIAPSTIDFLAAGESAVSVARAYLSCGPPTIARAEVELVAPVTRMDKVICIGMNYKDHCSEQNMPVPTEPLVFNKFPSCVAAPTADVPLPSLTSELDWEVELAVVMGREARRVTTEEAMDYVFGFTAAHDVSARDWQLKKNGGQWLLGKAMENFAPIGPAIVSRDEVGDPDNLQLSCKVNGEVKQDSSTAQFVFPVAEVVAWVSRFTVLLPGDLILTGTPPGVGAFMKPPQFLAVGDTVECWVQNIGSVVNRIVADS